MLCERVNYRIICFVLNILFSFLCIESFSQDREDTIAELKENYRIVRAENNVRIVRYDGYDDEMLYMLETAKALPSSADVDKENSKLLKHALQKYEVDNSVMLGVVRKHFSNKVDLAFVSFIVSKSGRFEYLYIFLLDRDNLKEKKCERCGRTEWQGFDIPLGIHHKNGDNHDNRIENLEILCPNCHALTDSYRGRNNKSATKETL